jgi:hypothetical protein
MTGMPARWNLAMIKLILDGQVHPLCDEAVGDTQCDLAIQLVVGQNQVNVARVGGRALQPAADVNGKGQLLALVGKADLVAPKLFAARRVGRRGILAADREVDAGLADFIDMFRRQVAVSQDV